MSLHLPRVPSFVLGAGLALTGSGLVETLLLAGLRPLTPVAWPGLAMVLAAALGGARAVAGGALVLVAYYTLNSVTPQRFPEFYGHLSNTVAWGAGLALLAAAVLALRSRLQFADAWRESEQRLRTITDNLPALVSYIDAAERYRFNNRVYESWLGRPRDQIEGRSVREVWGEEPYRLLKPNIERALRGERVSHEYAYVQGGVERHVLASYVPDVDASGRVRGFFVLGSDVTQLVAVQAELHAARERLESALDGSNVALWDADLRTGRVYLSEAWASIVGAPRGDTVATVQDLLALVHPEDVEATVRAAVETMKGERPVYAAEHRVRAHAGEWKWVLSRGRVTERDPRTRRAVRMVGTNVDITDRKRIEEAVQSVARADPLTGLANRIHLADRLKLAAARARRTGKGIAALYLDIDHFKSVNDSLGHTAGDALLQAFAARLVSCVRSTDTVARLGGDEFVVLLEEMRGPEDATAAARKILQAMRAPVRIGEREVAITASIGIAHGRDDQNPEALLSLADAALYEAKAAGRDTLRVAKANAQPR
ncbi:MAG: hypothetical protein A3G81_26780 [Betaproteobacteria bacterium RIFCSPLOWO2_12_FULL_65_14]|nr:MAG: hypothetical protein A3G81_26780 [Betaproteobacteria bacterium RIFCSPLOWO2_12_FULL_65_14]